MRTKLSFLILFVFLLAQCGLIKDKKADVQQDQQTSDTTLSAEKFALIQQAIKDSIENSDFIKVENTAFGKLMFGMKKPEIEQLNEQRQTLGKYTYNFGYLFNGDGKLYALVLNSDGEKAIKFETGLKSKHRNLQQIIEAKYGEAVSQRGYPSIFDVQNSKNYWTHKWEFGKKNIQMGIAERALNNYRVTCKISDTEMENFEIERLKSLKNKDIEAAAEKF